MTEMVERVAAAIYDRCNHWDYDDNLPPYSSLPDGAKAQWQDAAHHAIEAMRVPTFDMIEAGQQENNILPEPRDPPNAFEFLSRDEMTGAWEAMIDAALSPNQKE